jgi:hypothetical protein
MKDIFHVTQHYGATFCKPHPLRETALAELSAVFFGDPGARTKETRIPEPAVLCGRLQSWYDKFEKVLSSCQFISSVCRLTTSMAGKQDSGAGRRGRAFHCRNGQMPYKPARSRAERLLQRCSWNSNNRHQPRRHEDADCSWGLRSGGFSQAASRAS